MIGKIHQLTTYIIAQRSKGNATLAATTKAKLIVKGINPDNYNENSPDDEEIIEKLLEFAEENGIEINPMILAI
ncbi:MAG: hypothetical protein HPY45_18010 [Anaerolineae bacterium]|nr:hypothetical protein [Anaerolineae bacterium]